MRRFIVYSVLSLLFMATACNKDVELETALSLSGENRAELESALEHFKDDRLKYEAVRFLIVNMIGAYSYDDELKSICEPFYCKYDSLMRIHGYDSLLRIFDYGKMKLWDKQVDSLWNDFNLQNADNIKYKKVYDLQNITAQQLISEVELAFEAWQKNVYSRSCSFDEFCEYILPYRQRNGLVIDDARQNLNELHRKDFFVTENKRMTDEIDSLLHRYRHITHSGFAGMDIPILDFQTMVRLRHGLCEQRCWFNTILLSSLGLACATDFVPAWGNRNNSHTWNVVLKDGESYAFESFWDSDRWKYKRIYNNKECDSVWGRYRLPKVYRHTYKRYIEGPMADENEDIVNIPAFFKNERKKDVSKEYFETTDVTLDFENLDTSVRYVYLCVLNYGSWYPVQWGKVCNERVTFSAMGKGTIYLPMYCKNGIMFPCGFPFVLQESGEIDYIEPQQETEDIVVSHFSGALAFVKNKEFFKYIRGTVLLNENNDTLCVLPHEMELNTVKVKTKCEKPTRTIKMRLKEKTVALGRIEFFYESEDGLKKIANVKIINNLPISGARESPAWILDKHSSTGYACKIGKDFVEFDLGNNYEISEVRLCPYLYNDFETEVEYELCYWDSKKWKVADKQKGGNPMIFNNIPEDALLIIRPTNNTGRMGYRPFLYSNGEVYWY